MAAQAAFGAAPACEAQERMARARFRSMKRRSVRLQAAPYCEAISAVQGGLCPRGVSAPGAPFPARVSPGSTARRASEYPAREVARALSLHDRQIGGRRVEARVVRARAAAEYVGGEGGYFVLVKPVVRP